MNSSAFTVHPLIWEVIVNRDKGEFASMQGAARLVALALGNAVLAWEAAASNL